MPFWNDENHDRLYVRVGKSGGAWVEARNGRVVLRLDRHNKEHEPVELPLTYDVEQQRWVGGVDSDIAPTPGHGLPRSPVWSSSPRRSRTAF
jgi:hypothetical protein